jgi:hypothetical protein
VTQSGQVGGTVSYGYDRQFALSSMVVAGGLSIFEYDGD